LSREPTDAVVTGAGRGLGRAIAQALAADGARVWICSENLPELETTAALIAGAGGDARAIETDLAEPAACAAFVRSVTQGVDRLRVIVNNAAVLQPTRVEDLTLSQWSHTLAVMLTAPFLLTRDLLPLLQREGGAIINVSSRSSVMPFEGEAAYCAAKYGVEAFSQCLALELRSGSVSVNTITPGLKIKPTSLAEEQIATVPESERRQWHDPMEIMPAFLFLAGLRGEVTGHRFNAFELTGALRHLGPEETLARITEFYR
jgi:NAD(P)-dependent dehydrogenase (short-subunit alcohol dehydrogenase family)